MAKILNARPNKNAARTGKTLEKQTTVVEKKQKTEAVKQPEIKKQEVPLSEKISVPASNNAVENFVKEMRELVEPLAYMDEDTIRKNIELAVGNGMSADDRTISFECAQYVMTNLAYILMGVVLDESFRNTFVECLNLEIEFDKKSDKQKKKIRDGMRDKKNYNSMGSIVIGVSSFSPLVNKIFAAGLAEGFDTLEKHEDEFNNAVEALSDEEKTKLGFLFSNWMYLIRAFTHNDLFMSYIVTVIEEVKKVLNKR